MLLGDWKTMVRRRVPKLVAITVVFTVCGVSVGAQSSKKKANPADQGVQRGPTTTFDISKIVWPQPPDIARIKFENILTGQKIDWEDLQSKKKPKASWMDRLAGAQPDARVKDVAAKVGFQMLRPYGVVADSKGNIYAADQGVGAIFIFPGGGAENLQLIKNGSDAHFAMLCGLAVDDNDQLFVTDQKLHHVLVFNAKHEMEAQFGAAELVSPAGIALDTENRFIYVVDTQQDQVLVFDADNYKLLRRIGTAGKNHTLTGPGEFSLPTNVAVDKEGNVYVTDTLNNRVEIFDADGGFIREFGKGGDGPGYFARPKGITLDGDGHIWVADEVLSRVQVFDKEGRLLCYFGKLGWYPGQFQALYGIAFDSLNSRVFTTEQFPGRVQIFRYVTDAEAAAEKSRREAEQEKSAPKAPSSASLTGGNTPRE